MLQHTLENCGLCNEKLNGLNPLLHQYGLCILKNFPDCHISYGFRNKLDQDFAYVMKRSKLRWPNSKHNVTDESGLPNAEAIDLFRLGPDGKAYFEKEYYEKIWIFIEDQKMKIQWGGNWKSFKDHPHYELVKAE